jgi:endoglucanase
MLSARFRMKGIAIFATATLALAMTATPTLAAPGGGFYVPPPDKGAVNQIKDLVKKGSASDLKNAALLTAMVSEGHAVWFTGGTPGAVREQVKKTMSLASAQGTVPVLVAYNLPYRDCGQYSTGGAVSTAAYKAWIDGFAAGIGSSDAWVILEPDGLGLIPNYFSELDGSQNCPKAGETLSGPEATPAARFEQLNYAVDVLTALPNTHVYLDATHSGWQNVSETAFRLLKVHVEKTAGFFLNVSNYQYTSNEVMYGTWVSRCIAAAMAAPNWTGEPVGPLGSGFPNCPNQYWNGGPLPSLTAVLSGAWQGIALDPYGVWSDTDTTVVKVSEPIVRDGVTIDTGFRAPLNTSAINLLYKPYPAGTTHFVIDTSRNGQGPWNFAADSEGLFRTYEDFAADGDALADGYTSAGAAQDWCNPPGRGLGPRPTANPNALVDAYLWIKVPGESDGSCARPAGGTTDAEWGGIVDPAAGAWFPQQALELANLANPALLP